MTADYDDLNYFRADSEIHQCPYPYYEWLRAHGPVWQHPRGVVYVTGYDEAISIYHDHPDLVELQHDVRTVREDVGSARG